MLAARSAGQVASERIGSRPANSLLRPPTSLPAQADVIVIGGGPAGAAAAIASSALGLSTILLAGHRHGPPRPAETVSQGIELLLARLGAREALRAAALSAYDGIAVAGHTDAGVVRRGWHIDRDLFDAALIEHARAAGADVISESATGAAIEGGRPARLTTSCGRRLTARFVIDATGQRRFLRSRVGARLTRLSPPLVAWRGASDAVAANLDPRRSHFSPSRDGWAFLAPTPRGTAWTILRRSRSDGVNAPAGAAPGRAVTPGRPWNVGWRIVRPLAGPGFALAGDAGGHIDPATGQGLFLALWSGLNAAHTARAYLASANPMPLVHYDRWFADRLFGAARDLAALYRTLGIGLLDRNPQSMTS